MIKRFKLPRRAVRRIAKRYSKSEEIPSNLSNVLSFLVRTQTEACRVQVYLDTATAVVMRVLNDEVRHVFHRNCSEKKLQEIFRNPTELTMINADGMETEREILDFGSTILAVESETLKSHYSDIVEDDHTCEERECTYCLPQHLMFQVENILKEAKTGETVECAAISAKAALIVFTSGSCIKTKGLPTSLSSLLDSHDREDKPVFVELGTKNRFFVKFDSGESYWEGPESLGSCIENNRVRTVTFGRRYDDFFVVYEDGSWKYEGDVPDDLSDLLTDRNHAADLICVALGPKDEYFCKARNGRMWWGGVSDDTDEAIDNLVNGDEDNDIHHICFSENDGYFIISANMNNI